MPGSEWRFRAFGLAQRRLPQERQSAQRCTAKLFWTSHPPPLRGSTVRLADADLSAVPLPTVRVPLYHHASPGTIPARAMPTRCRADWTGDGGAFEYQGSAATMTT